MTPDPPAGPPPLDAARWDARYAAGDTPWDLGEAPPALLDELPRWAGASCRVLVPGAGRAHDAIAWARAGHRVTAVDHAPRALREARVLADAAGVAIDLLEADVLALPAPWDGTFDVVWEQTCLCALEPGSWPAYVDAMARALLPGGRLLALLWHHGRAGGPPFDVAPADVARLFPPRFEVEAIETPRPNPRRRPEFLARLRRRP